MIQLCCTLSCLERSGNQRDSVSGCPEKLQKLEKKKLKEIFVAVNSIWRPEKKAVGTKHNLINGKMLRKNKKYIGQMLQTKLIQQQR